MPPTTTRLSLMWAIPSKNGKPTAVIMPAGKTGPFNQQRLGSLPGSGECCRQARAAAPADQNVGLNFHVPPLCFWRRSEPPESEAKRDDSPPGRGALLPKH